MPRHIPPGREDLWRRQAEADAEIERLDAVCDAAGRKARELAKVLDPDDSIVEDADEEFARLFDERNRAIAVADAVYRERIAGLTSWIDHDPTAPICSDCHGTGGPPGCDAHGACSTCRGWGREHREPIPVWSETAQAWINPATGRTVDLLADPAPTPKPAPTQPTTTPTTGSTGGAMASIEEVRALMMRGNELLTEALGMEQQAAAQLEEAQQLFLQAAEGADGAGTEEVRGMVARAIETNTDTVQNTSAAIQSIETVAAHLAAA